MADYFEDRLYDRIPCQIIDGYIVDAIDGEIAAPIAALLERLRMQIPMAGFVKISHMKTLLARAIKVAYDKGFDNGLSANAISENMQWEEENRDVPEDLQTKRPKSTAEAVISIFDASCHISRENRQESTTNLPPHYIAHPALGRVYHDGRQGTTEFSYTREDGTVSQFDPNIISPR